MVTYSTVQYCRALHTVNWVNILSLSRNQHSYRKEATSGENGKQGVQTRSSRDHKAPLSTPPLLPLCDVNTLWDFFSKILSTLGVFVAWTPWTLFIQSQLPMLPFTRPTGETRPPLTHHQKETFIWEAWSVTLQFWQHTASPRDAAALQGPTAQAQIRCVTMTMTWRAEWIWSSSINPYLLMFLWIPVLSHCKIFFTRQMIIKKGWLDPLYSVCWLFGCLDVHLVLYTTDNDMLCGLGDQVHGYG